MIVLNSRYANCKQWFALQKNYLKNQIAQYETE